MNQSEIKKVVKSGDENKLIQLLTRMNNRITLLEKQKLDNHVFYDYKRKKKGWFSSQSSSYPKKKRTKRRNN
tara:strand:+ start:403 stop:618 length:216 start_codon:yes stop_codon:yes gene_type:complete